jgi:hypothetical protein
MLSIIALLIFFSLLATSLEAACTGTSVAAFGAKGDGQTDDSAAIHWSAGEDRNYRPVLISTCLALL